MATFTHLDLASARAIGAAFDVAVERVVPIPAGSVNSNYRLEGPGGAVFARVYEEQDAGGAEDEARLLDHLARGGVATPRPIARADGRGFTATLGVAGPDGARELRGTRPVALFPWVDGEILCQKRVDARAARAVGVELARTHLAAAGFGERRPGRFRIEDLRARLLRIEREASPELAAAAPGLRERLDRAVAERDAELPGAIVHGDLFRDNVLWSGGRISALLDFESACEGSFAYDLMVTALAWCFGDDLELELVEAMFAGYQSVRELEARERAALAVEGRVAALRFATTRITDFAMRAGIGERVMKDWRRFFARHERVAGLGAATFERLAAGSPRGGAPGLPGAR